MNDHWNVLYQVAVFYADRKSKMATITGHKLTMDPMGKCSNAFFSETTNMIKAKLHECSLDGPLQTLRFLFVQFVEDHPMNIHVQFGFNHICSF
jgi:hypothetical protein